MMPELRKVSRSVRSTASTVTTRVVEVVSTLVVVGGLAGWSLFWSNLVRLHYSQGDLASALFTAATLIAPAIAGLVWYVGASLEIEILTPDIDMNMISSHG